MKKLFILLLLLIASLSARPLVYNSWGRIDTTVHQLNPVTDGVEIRNSNGDSVGTLTPEVFKVLDSALLVDDSFSAQQHMDALRFALNPWRSITYLPFGAVFETPSITANIPTKILIPTAIKEINGFAFNDIGGGNLALQFEAPMGIQDSIGFNVTMTTSMRTSANNVIVTLAMYKNGAQEEGILIKRKISTGTDTGALAIHGHFHLVTGDYIEIYVTVTTTTTVTFESTSIDISEKY